MARNYAALPHEYMEEMAELTDEEWGRLTRALLWYSISGEETDLTGNERFFWRRVVNREKGLQQHYEEVSARRSEIGKKAAAARWGHDASCMPMHASDAKDKVKDKDKDKVYSSPVLGGGSGYGLLVEKSRKPEQFCHPERSEGSFRG